MNNPPQYASFPRPQKKNGLSEVETLLELLPDPALLVELRGESILLANALALELTAYSRLEITGMQLKSMFPYEKDTSWLEQVEPGENIQLDLLRRNRTITNIHLEITPISLQNKWILLTLVESQLLEQRHANQRRRDLMLKSMSTIAGAFQQEEFTAALNMLLEAAEIITGAKFLSIYMQQISPIGEAPEIARIIHRGPTDVFPASLPAEEFSAFRNAHFWSAGKRPTSSLQRAGRAAGINHIINVPLGQRAASIGVLLLAGDFNIPLQHQLEQAKILALSCTSLIEYHSQLSYYKSSLTTQRNDAIAHQVIENSVTDGAVVLTKELKVERMNRSAEIMLGYSSEEAHGHRAQNILISSASLDTALEQALAGATSALDENFHLYRRSGQSFQARMKILPASIHGEIVGIVILFRDMSEHEQIQAQAQQLEQNALLGEVTAIFAHEVRNPINNISTGLQLMSMHLASEDPNQEIIGRLQQDCERLDDLMRSVLAFAKPTDYAMEAVEIGPLLSRLLDRQRPRLQKATINLLLDAKPDLPPVRANPRALEQVFTNLITNAVQAVNEKGGTVAVKVQAVTTSGEKSLVQVDVADNGPGIPKELLDRLFQPFFTTKTDGTGLGLAITKRIITAHKGNIRVTSFPGGTIFHVQLPVMETA